MPGLLLLLGYKPTIFAAWLHLACMLRLGLLLLHLAGVGLHVGKKFWILQELLGDAHAKGVHIASRLVQQAPLVEPPHHFLTGASRVHHAKPGNRVLTVLACLVEVLPGVIKQLTMAHRRHLHVRLESDVRGLLLDLLLDHPVVGRGI